MVTWLGVTGRVVSETGYTLDRTGGVGLKDQLAVRPVSKSLEGWKREDLRGVPVEITPTSNDGLNREA